MNHERKKLLGARLCVIKLGTGTLSSKDGRIMPSRIQKLARQVATLRKMGKRTILVSSGAISAGMTRLRLHRRPTRIADLQACAAVGQNLLMAAYERSFAAKGLTVAQILLTHDDFTHPDRRKNARNTILNLLQRNVTPVINENDAVSFAEIQFGDNDQLASMVHQLIHADACIILSNVDGFLIPQPPKNTLRVLPSVRGISSALFQHAGASQSQRSVGGMRSKLLAARRVLACKSPLVVANGRTPHILTRLFQGEILGTIFLPR